jgi:hypothetical protein
VRHLLAALAVAVLMIAGCGSAGPPNRGQSERRLSRSERAQVDHAKADVHAYCRLVGRFLARGQGPPSRQVGQRASDAVKRLGSLARSRPKATNQDGETVAEVMGDIAEDLEGTNCSNALAAELDAELRTVPQPRK